MKERPLSHAQLRMLRSVGRGGKPLDGVFGQAAHGGASGTIASLQRRNLLVFDGKRWKLTRAGVDLLAENEA